MKVTEKDLDTTAHLSRLAIADEERERYQNDLDSFLSYVDNLQSVDTSNIQPTTYALPIQNVFREDELRPSLTNEEALSNAPAQDNGYFKVPKVLEG